MRLRLYIILLFLCSLATGLSARDQMRYQRYTPADGLPANRITSMCEDKAGNIWMNTWNGLCYWDGQRMTGIISTADGQRFGRTNGATMLKDGRLLFRNDDDKMMCYDPTTNMLCNLPLVLDTIPHHVTQIMYNEVETGLVFVRKGVAYHLQYDDGLRMEKQLHFMYEDSQGQVWFDFNNSLYRIWFEPSPFCFFQYWPEGRHCQFQSTVRALSTDEDGNLLAASRNYKMYGLNDSVTDIPYPGNVYEMVPDTKYDRLWLALRKKGLYVNTPEGIRPAMDNLSDVGLSDLFSLLMLRDQPYLWCGTWGDGVRIVDVRKDKPSLKRVLYNDSLTSVHKMIQLSNGLVGICSTRGFHIYSASGVPVYVVASELDVLNAVELPDERVYLCAMGKGQYIMETNGILLPDRTTKIDDRISTLYRVGESDIWMVSDSRIFRYNFVSGKVDVLDTKDFGTNMMFAENSITVCHDSLLYIGASSGMLEINLNEFKDYIAQRDQAEAEAHEDQIRNMVWNIVFWCLLLIVLIAVVVILFRYFVSRKVSKQVGTQVSISHKEEIKAEDREFFEKLSGIINQMISDPNADMSQLATMMGMPKNAFYMRCNETFHSTPASILQDMRIEYAKNLMMKERNCSVKEISYKVGFNDPKYFSKVFKAKMNITPTKFLEQLGKH